MTKPPQCKKLFFVCGVCSLGALMAVFYLHPVPNRAHGVRKIDRNPFLFLVGNDILTPSNTRQQTPQDRNQQNVTIVLILAYMHTGSSFTGSMFQQHPGTFYEYEPLRALQQETRAGRKIHFLDGSDRFLNGTDIDVSIATNAVSNMIMCNHGDLDTSSLSYVYFGPNSSMNRDKSLYYTCQGQTKHQLSRLMPEHSIRRCLPLLIGTCQDAILRVFKFIRLDTEVVGSILNRYPTVKLIHLVRDPRAMMDSQVRKNDMGTRFRDRFIKNVQYMCSKMMRHLNMTPDLKRHFPGRIFQLRYEDLVENPMKVSRDMFDFVNVPFSRTLQSYVWHATIGRQPDSSSRFLVWRNHISSTNLQIVNRYCDPLYQQLGYIGYTNVSDIRNLTKVTYKSFNMNI